MYDDVDAARVSKVVADAVLFAWANPRRMLYAGGGGLLSSLFSQAAPRLVDAVRDAVDTRVQQKPYDAVDPARRDDLYEPRTGMLRGRRQIDARGSSVALHLQKLPRGLFTIGLIGVGIMLTVDRRLAKGR